MNYSIEDTLMHYGVSKVDGAPGPGSGRYPLGSGDNPNQRNGDFIARVNKMRNSGMTDAEIARELKMLNSKGEPSSKLLRTKISIINNQIRYEQVAIAKELKDRGYSTTEVGRRMGLPESTVRSLLDKDREARMNEAKNTAEFLKKQVDEKGIVDVGKAVEKELHITRTKMDEAIYMLQMEGYELHGGRTPQVTNPGKWTTLSCLCVPGTPHKDIFDPEKVKTLNDYESHDDGKTFDPKFVYPKSMDISRLQIKYAEDGGINRDGLIEIRRGVSDLDLGGSHYAQVRILVDNDRYLKGMAVYSDDLPDGIDVRFNTNKTKDKAPRDVLKPITKDASNPFGALIKDQSKGGQYYYTDKNGNKQLGLINKKSDEGDWSDWKDKLPSQFLAKQDLTLIKKQLGMSIDNKKAEFEDIKAITNPTIRKKLLWDFAEGCDSDAVHLQAAALPRQKYRVLLPLEDIKDNEVYAPTFKDGETVALIRYPHGGTFEIPILKVNNKNAEGKKYITPQARDAVGINKKVADRLSGADFDGDTVMVVPCNSSSSNIKIKSTHTLKGLEGFDPKMEYPGYTGMKVMKNTQNEMGRISNLITDMTLLGANEDELARAVRHSMVVIDAEKHKLDYKRSEKENDIKALKKKYQGRIKEDTGRYSEGAATLISKAKAEVTVLKRRGSPEVNDDGALSWKTAHDLEYVDYKTGKTKLHTQRSNQMSETDDAMTLLSPMRHPKEIAYGEYANNMKHMANEARKLWKTTPLLSYSSTAAQAYAEEVQSLKDKLTLAEMNRPKERAAQTMANAMIKSEMDAIVRENPGMSDSEIKSRKKKVSQEKLTEARTRVGAKRNPIEITDKEWEAIQAGAIHDSTLKSILDFTDADSLRDRATPHAKTELSPAKQDRIQAMRRADYTLSEIADALGTSVSTVEKYVKGE